MSKSFTQKNISAFLVEQGASEAVATTISNHAVVAVRPTSTGAEIKDQSVNADFTKYDALLLAADNSEITVAYAIKKLGAGFFEHGVSVTHGEQSYGLSSLVHVPLGVDVDVTEAKAVVAEVKEFVADVVEDTKEFIEEVKEIFAEEVVEEAPVAEVEAEVVAEEVVEEVVEAPVLEEVAEVVEEVVAEEVVEAPVVEEVAEEVVAAAAPEAEAPVKKSKAKKAK